MSRLVYLNAVIRFAEHFVKLVEREVFREQLVSESVHFDQTLQLHDACIDQREICYFFTFDKNCTS